MTDTSHISTITMSGMKATLNTERLNKVLEDWDMVRALPDWDKHAGRVLFQHLFEKCPEAKPLFGFSMGISPRSDNILKNSRFARHSKFLIKMVDKTVMMLVSESETSDDEGGGTVILTDILIKLGKKHVSFGVKPEWFPFMTESLIAMLEEIIGDANAVAWRDVFDFLCFHMDYGHKLIDKDYAAGKDKAICMAVWDRFSKVPQYKRKGGLVLFQKLFDLCPQVMPLFGFPHDTDPQSKTLLKSARFALHSQFLINMLEETIGLLGEDNETLSVNLLELGKKHVSFGVTPEMFPYMTDSLIAMMNELLGKEFTPDDQESVENVMSLMIADLVKGQRTVDKTLADNNKDIAINTWERLTKIPDYQMKGGLFLFQTLFSLCPEAKLLFGFPEDTDPTSEKLLNNELFKKHAVFLLNMIGKTVSMLGYASKDNDKMEADLMEIGRKHVTYGVKAEYFPLMNRSVIKTLKEMLGGDFSDEEAKAWEDILSLFVADMVKGQRTLDMGLAAANTNVTKRNWDALKRIKDYDKVGGIEIFHNLFSVCPEAKPFFGFREDFPMDEIRRSKRILVHGSFIVEMVERALDWIGQDDFELQKMLHELGTNHSQYNVKPEHMPYMQKSIIIMLKTLLKEDAFSSDDERAWDSVLSSLVANITRAQRAIAMKKLSEELVL